MANVQKSIAVNKDFLLNDLGLKQISNTTIFRKNDCFVLSPSVQNKHNWFDLREVNVNKYNPDVHKGYLLIRFKDRLLVANLKVFQQRMLKEELIVHSNVMTPHWKFIIQEASIISAINQKDKNEKFELQECTKQQLIEHFSVY